MSPRLNYLYVTETKLLSYRRSLPLPGIDWTASRIPLCYLDPAVPNEKLSKIHLDKLFRRNGEPEGVLLTLFLVCENEQRRSWFSLDDSSVGCDRKSDGKKKEPLGIELFYEFVRNKDKSTLQQWAIRFLNMFTVFGVREWNNSKWNEYHQLDVFFGKIYPFVLKSLFEKRREQPLLVRKFWDVCRSNYTRITLFIKVPHKDHLEFMLQVANMTRFDFWGMRRGETDYIKDIIFFYLWKRRFDWISLLIDYGFKLENILPRLIRREFNELNFHRGHYNCESPHPCKGPLSNIHIMWFLAALCSKKGDINTIPGFVNMFQMLFRSLSLPTVPHAIVRKCLQPVFPEDIDAQIKHFYECGLIYPIDCEEEVQPKLSHLCRRVVRERLAKNFQLPAGINALILPTSFKRFLRLEF